MRLHRVVVAVVVSATLACGGGGDGGGGVTNPPPTTKTLDRIDVSPAAVTVAAGQSQALTASGLASDGTAVGGTTFTYSSSATAVASVSSAGRVLGIAAGTATITVTGTAGSVSRTATVNVTVNGSLPNAIVVEAGAQANEFTPRDVAIQKGGSVTWTFPGIAHNVDFQGQSGAPANIGNTSNNTNGVSRSFANSGSYAYICSLHGGMGGTVLVP